MDIKVVLGTSLALGLLSLTTRAGGGGQAVEETKLLAAGTSFQDQFGQSAAAWRETVVVGGPYVTIPGLGNGAAYVFAAGPGGWVQQAALVDPVQPASSGAFGQAVAIEGDTIAVSAPTKTSSFGDTGRVSVFTRAGATWTHEQTFAPPDGADFGGGLDLDQGVLLVGDVAADGVVPLTGAAYVFERVGGVWTQTAKLFKAVGETSDNLGQDVALSGDTALVGDPTDSLAGEKVGSATVFERVGTSWVEGPTLFGPTPEDDAWFGFGLDLEGDWAVIGAWKEDRSGPDAGAAHVYERSGATWSYRQTLTGAGVTQQERFGQSVAIQGTRILVGSPWDDPPGGFRDGSVYRFEFTGVSWSLAERLAPTGLGPNDSFGWAVALDGDLVVGTAPGDDELANNAGAAYLLRAPPFRTTYCTAGTSASGCKALISAAGTPSAAASSGFDLIVDSVEGSKRGLFFWGANGRKASPWGTGPSYQCVVLPPSRGALLKEVGTNGACDASYTYDLAKRWTKKPNQNPGAGAVVQAQFWYRDPFNGFIPKTSLSDAIEFVACP